MREKLRFSPDEQQFINRAIDFCQSVGERAVLMLVGSRAAGFADTWSDLDLWVIGDKGCLSDEERRIYQRNNELFVDRGDYEAHFSFYDERALCMRLQTWADEMMWIISTSRTLYGHSSTAEELKRCYRLYPRSVAECKLKWLFGKYYFSQRGPLAMAARNKVETAFIAVGNVIESLCKICCVVERQPFPYDKWLFEAAKQTQLGTLVHPSIQRAIAGIGDFIKQPTERHWRDWVPLKELRATLPIVQRGLKELGWDCDWVAEPNAAYFNTTVQRPAP